MSDALPLDVTVVVLHYRYGRRINALLRSLHEQTPRVADTVVVDNGSADGSLEQLVLWPGQRLLALPDNVGYAGAMNAALASADTTYALLVTHDVLLARDAVDALLARLVDAPQVAAVGPLLGDRRDPAAVWSAGGALGRRTRRPYHRDTGTSLGLVQPGHQTCCWLDGAVLALRLDSFRAVGRFDETFFLYEEERDLLARLWLAGWQVEVVRDALAWQQPSMTPPYLQARNRLRFDRKHASAGRQSLAISEQLLQVAVALTRRRDLHEGRCRVMGIRHAFSGELDRDLASYRSRSS